MKHTDATILESIPSKGMSDGGRILADTLPVCILCFRLDEDCSVLWGNTSFYRHTGYSIAEFSLYFKTLRQFYYEFSGDFAFMQSKLHSAWKAGQSDTSFSLRLPSKYDSRRWVRFSASILKDTQESPLIQAVLTDISDMLDQYDQKSRQCEEKTRNFEFMMDEYMGNVYISDMETYDLLYLNKPACDTIGLPPEKMLGRKCYEVIQGRTSPCPFCTNDRLCEDAFYEWEFFNPKLDRTFMIKNRVVNWKGRRARIELSHDNYSLEYQLAKKDREREAILRTIPGGFTRLDARDMSTILWHGGGFLSLIGYTQEQFEKELHSQCSYIDPDDMTRILEIAQKAKITGENAIMEAHITTRSGKKKILTITLSYVSKEDSWDGIPSFYSVGIDVTREREEQELQRHALEDAYQAARVASDAKTNFLSSMSHDIRTPMNAIMGMTAIAQTNLHTPEKVSDCLNQINVSSRHLLSLINEVLDMSKIESGKINLMPEDVDLPDLMQDVMNMCRPLIAAKHQELRISAGRVQHEKIVADGDRLQQVFMNLLSNAVKYTPEGGVISLRINEFDSPIPTRGQFEFIFTDNGIGMSDEYIPHIFEPFSRAEDSRISKVQGTGLGMAITDNIVRMMNGSIQVKSKLGQGSQFTVAIPLGLRADDEICENELVGNPVLVVDDDQIVCENATALLDELGMRGYWVLSGAQAVRRVEEAHRAGDDFFAVILDWRMPDMNGLDTLKAIRQKLDENVPIIIISAYDYSEIEDEFIRAGADAFITKPLFKSKMLHVLQTFCSSHKQEASTPMPEKNHTALNGKRVLLAEDNDLNREIAVELLQMNGLVVDAVENGERAVEVFKKSSFGTYAAVLMDIQMPVLNGYDATSVIRALPRSDAHTIPIIALTANAFASDVGKSRSAGMNDHISKPMDVERLLDVLQKWMA